MQRPPRDTLLPYTTLFRSVRQFMQEAEQRHEELQAMMSETLTRHRELVRKMLSSSQEEIPEEDEDMDEEEDEEQAEEQEEDRKSTRLNSSHSSISYAVFCL